MRLLYPVSNHPYLLQADTVVQFLYRPVLALRRFKEGSIGVSRLDLLDGPVTVSMDKQEGQGG